MQKRLLLPKRDHISQASKRDWSLMMRVYDREIGVSAHANIMFYDPKLGFKQRGDLNIWLDVAVWFGFGIDFYFTW